MGSLHRRSHADGRWAGENSGQSSGHSSVGSGALMLQRRMPVDAGHAVHVPTSLEIRDQVNGFLASLPLGVTRRDAELEDCIAAHLHELHSARAGVQLKLSQWVSVALGLQEVVERQHAELAKLLEAQRAQHAQRNHKHSEQQMRGLPDVARPDQASDGMDLTLLAHHAELAQLRAQMTSLRQDLLSAARAGNAAAAVQPSAPVHQAQEGLQAALEEQLQARTAEVQAARAEADRLRSALIDVELELQLVTSANTAAHRGEQDKARLAAEALAAAYHQTRPLQECIRRQAAEITRLRADATTNGTASVQEEGTPQDAALGELTAKRHALEHQVAELQGRVQKAAAEREGALARAQSEQQVLVDTAGTLQAQQSAALAAERAAKEALAQEFQAFWEEARAQHDGLLRQMAADAAAAAEGRSLREELSLERRHCSALEAALAERDSALASVHQQLAQARSHFETTLAEQQSACTSLQQELAQERRQFEGTIKALEAALAEQQAARASLQQQLIEERSHFEAALAEHQSARAGLEGEKSQLQAAVSVLESEMQELAGAKASLEEEARRWADELELQRDRSARIEQALVDERERSCMAEPELAQWRERCAAAEQALEEERERRARAEEARAAEAGRLGQQLAELACQVDDERAAASKRADIIADLSARVAAADATWQTRHCEAMFDLQAAHSEELERLQSEHTRELAGLAATAEADREHGAAVAAALRSRSLPSSEPASPSPSSSVLRGCASHRSSPDLSTAALRGSDARGAATASVGPMRALQLAPAAEAGMVLRGIEAERGTQQADVAGRGKPHAAGAAQGRLLLAMLAAMTLTSARPAAPADAVCRVTLGHPPASSAVGGNAVVPDTQLPGEAKSLEPADGGAAAEDSAGPRGTPPQTRARPPTERLRAEHEARVARERERSEAALAELQNRHAAELAALKQHFAEHDSAVQEQQERLAQKYSADLAALQRRQDMALAELQEELTHSAAPEPGSPQISLGDAQEQRPEDAAFLAQHEAAVHEQLAVQTEEHQAALMALEDMLNHQHAVEIATLEQQHSEAVSHLKEILTQAHAADLAALQERLTIEVTELRKQHSSAQNDGDEQRVEQAADLAAQHANVMAELQASAEQQHRSQLSAVQEDLAAGYEAELAALRSQHESALADIQVIQERRRMDDVAAWQEELGACHEAELAALRERHESALADIQVIQERRRMDEGAALRDELGACHEAELAALREQHANALAELQASQERRHMEEVAALREELGARHEAQLLTILARQFEAGVLSDAEAIKQRTAVEQQHREACLQLQEELEFAHASEESAVREQHEQALAQAHEHLTTSHVAKLTLLKEQHKEALLQVQQELEDAHASELSALKEQHEQAMAQMSEELTATHTAELAAQEEQLLGVLAQTREDLTAAHLAELAAVREEQVEALTRMQEEFAAAHEADLAALEQLHSEALARREEELREAHEAELSDLNEQHGEALQQVHKQLADARSAQLPAREHAEVEQQQEASANTAGLELLHREDLQRLTVEHSQEIERMRCECELQVAVMEEMVANARSNCDERVQRYKEKLKAANEALQQTQQQQTQQQEAQREPEEEFVIHRRSMRGAGTPLNRAWQTERKPNLRHAMAQLEADNADLLARCRAAEAAAAAESAAADALRAENLELASELAEADATRHAAADAAREARENLVSLHLVVQSPPPYDTDQALAEAAAADALRAENLNLASKLAEANAARYAAVDAAREAQEKLVSLQLVVQDPSSAAATSVVNKARPSDGEISGALAEVVEDPYSAAAPSAVEEASRSDQDDREALAEAVQALTERCEALEADNARLQAQVGGALGEELKELQEACLSMRRSNEELAAQLAALQGGDTTEDTSTLAEENAALRHAVADLEAKLEALGDAAALAEENAALRRMLADLDAELAALAADSERLRDENLELSSAVAVQSMDAVELEEMAETLAERDAIEEDLRAQLSDLHALLQARGSPGTGASDAAKLVGAQLRIEALQAELHAAATEQVQQDSTGVCSRCGEALASSNSTPEKGTPDPQAAGRAADGAGDAAGAPGEGGAAMVTGGPSPAAGGAGDPATEGGGPLQVLREAHAAELASMQDAFAAQMQALQDDLQQKEELLERQQEELEAAAEEVTSRQEALLECQDMLAELQSFSEAQQVQLHALQQNLQGAQGQASQAQAAAQEAEEQLRGQQECAEEATRRLEEAQSALALREGTLQELTLETQRLQLELSETRGRLRATEAAAAESSGRVESLAARLAATHNAKPIGMIWQNPSQGGELSATGSGLIVKALQGLSQEMAVRVPSRRASPAPAPRSRAAAGVADVSNEDVSRADVTNPFAMAGRKSEQQRASDARVHASSMHAEDAMPPAPSLAEYFNEEQAATQAAASGWESDQENDGSGRGCYSLPPASHRNAAQRYQERQTSAESQEALRSDFPAKRSGHHADASPAPNSPFGSLHNNALFGDSGSPSSPELCWTVRRKMVADTPTPLRSRDNPMRDSGGSPFRSGRSSPLRGRKSLRASQGSSPLRTLQRRDKAQQERNVGSHVLEGRDDPLRDAQELRGSGGSSPERTRDLPRRCKSGPLQVGSRVVAAQRSLFLSPPVEAALPLPSPPDGVRDIAGRWHGTPSPQWRA